METYRNYIDGRWVDAEGGEVFESTNPADRRDIVGVVAKSSKEDVDRAVEAARAAYNTWRLVPAPKRGEILFRAAEALVKHKQRLGELVTREMGKVIAEGLGDVQEAIDMAYYMAGEGRRLAGETVPSELPDKDAKSFRVPIGVFALVTPWNFPTAIPAWKIFPAIMAGNTVVFKPSSLTAVCATELVRILADSGLPKGVVNLVNGPGGEVGEYLVSHPGIDGVSFTGSSAVGMKVARNCSLHGKEFSCEMGGKNAIIVMDDADIGLALSGVLWGAFGTTGQRCTAASRLILHRDIHDGFVDRLVTMTKALKLGDGLKAGTDVGPLVSDEQLRKVQHYVQIGKSDGATLLLGGQHANHGDLAYGNFMEMTIFVDVRPAMRIAQEEIFGPVLSVLKARDFDDAIAIANGVNYGLSASIYTRDVNMSAQAEKELDTGIVYINASTIGAEIQLPFGGMKRSGYGNKKDAGGRGGALDLYTRWKVVYRDYSGRLQRAQID
ncbi:MAG: aldehyde dehydrogenase family protein [Nitrospirae bacterium]|nr:aldehyde dehydrogenase family protein [Nitrospirota bacterium]